MKKHELIIVLSFLALAFTLPSCTSECSDMPSLSDSDYTSEAEPWIRTDDEIAEIAIKSTEMLVQDAPASRNKDRFQIKSISYFGEAPKGRSTSTQPHLAIVNFEDNAGFAVVSRYKSMPELIVIAEDMNYNSEFGTDNPGLQMYMESIQNPDNWNLSSIDIPEEPFKPAIFERTLKDTITKNEIAPRVKVRWGQGNAAGQFCPNKTAGCSNVALAMAMSYCKKPTSIAPTYIHPNHGNIALDWNKLTIHNNDIASSWYDECLNETYPIHDTYGKLLRELGHRSGTEYGYNENGNGSSGTPINGTYQTAAKLGLDVIHVNSYNAGDTKKRLTYGIILLAGSRLVSEGEYSRHMWVCDGYNYYYIQERYQQKEGTNGTWKTIHTDYHSYLYNHFNWGWNGLGNGYYLDMQFGPSVKDYKYDVEFLIVKP